MSDKPSYGHRVWRHFVGAFFYRGAQVVITTLCVVWWRADIKGRGNVPKNGAFLLCPVHRANIDGPLTCIMTKRRMKYLAKDSIFKIEWLGNVFRDMGAIPVARGVPDRASLLTCVAALESGSPLVLFPEGTRKFGPAIDEVQEGAVYMAAKAGVPIVPVGIGGSARANPKGSVFLRPSKLAIRIGKPITFAVGDSGRVPRSAIREGTETLQETLQSLFDEAEEWAHS